MRSCCVVLGDQDGWGTNRLSKAESILGTGMSQNLSRGRRHACAYGLRRLGLTGTAFAKAQSTTIRLKLLKIGARLRLTARKVWLSFSEAYPYASDIAQILANLKQHPAWSPPG